jgi:uncharacterized protein YdbL (DUF1318 family)
MKKLLITLLFYISFGIGNVSAAELGTAKSQGLIGETPHGYLEAVGDPSTEIQSLIHNINSQRRDMYTNIAESNSTDLTSVEQMAGEKAMNMTQPGNFIKMNGEWKKK